jgi:hypothetical protein
MNRNSLHLMPFFTVIAILLSALVSVSGRAAPPTVCFTADLDGDQEVPPVATAGCPHNSRMRSATLRQMVCAVSDLRLHPDNHPPR